MKKAKFNRKGTIQKAMSLADQIFINTCRRILFHGTSTESADVRAKWEDTNEPAYTIKEFGVVNRYDLRKEFPAITLRQTYIKSAIDEILWIYQKKSNQISDLKSHIWDQWADKEGTIGKAYGYQIGKPYCHHLVRNPSKEEVEKLFAEGYSFDNFIDWYGDEDGYPYFRMFLQEDKGYNQRILENNLGTMHINVYLDQTDAVLYDLKHHPFSRRIMTYTYNFEDLHAMGLYPCAYSCTFNVTDEGGDKLTLNMILNQRSQDMLVAGNWNVVQYAALLMMIAQVSNMEAGELVHVISDCHIYDRHIPLVKKIIQRETYDAPIVTLDPTITNFYDFTPDSFHIENYQYGEQIKNIPVAV